MSTRSHGGRRRYARRRVRYASAPERYAPPVLRNVEHSGSPAGPFRVLLDAGRAWPPRSPGPPGLLHALRPARRAGLEDYDPPQMTRSSPRDGTSLLDTFAEQRRHPDRVPTTSPGLPSTPWWPREDASFYRHTGIDFKGIARAAWRDLRSLRLEQGASTLTQQLARNLFLQRDKTIRRKLLQEALLALEIERQYTKQEILAFYCNQIYMGHGRYGSRGGLAALLRAPARELSLGQAATLAGLIQRPESLSPCATRSAPSSGATTSCAGWWTVGLPDPEEAETRALAAAARLRRARGTTSARTSWRRCGAGCRSEYGSSSLYQEGLTVHTTLDPRLQEIANRRRGSWPAPSWTGARAGVASRTGARPGRIRGAGSRRGLGRPELEVGRVHDGVVSADEPSGARGCASGPYEGRSWAPSRSSGPRTKRPDELPPTGRSRFGCAFSISGGTTAASKLELEQVPVVEAALVALDPRAGAVKALVGGFDFERSEFDRAIQATRQTGSAFKPFVYAAALDSRAGRWPTRAARRTDGVPRSRESRSLPARELHQQVLRDDHAAHRAREVGQHLHGQAARPRSATTR